jgi:hypothetical protein
MDASTAAGSTSWSKVTTYTWSRCIWSPSGANDCTVGGGVVNCHDTASASAPPVADSVPAGTVTVNVVAIGSRSTSPPEASKRKVRVPIHCQRPGTSGVRVMGRSAVATWPTVPTETIGWLNVMAM